VGLSALAVLACTISNSSDSTMFNVMCFNIRLGVANDGENSWQHRSSIAFAVIEKHQPAILGIQEAYDFQIDALRVRFPQYKLIGVGREDGKRKGEFSAIFYDFQRFKHLSSDTIWLSDTPRLPNSYHWGNTITRICTWAILQDSLTNRRMIVLNTHWDHQSQNSRARSADMIRSLLNSHSKINSIVLMGDLNANEENPAYQSLIRGKPKLISAFRALYPYEPIAGSYHGFTGQGSGGLIDHILVSPNWKIRRAVIDRFSLDNRFPSDHFPIVATLE